jgi:hypothetical protein
MMSVDLVDIALMVKGLRTTEEARLRWPFIFCQLAEVLRRDRRSRRRSPGAEEAVEWLLSGLAAAPISGEERDQAEALIAGLYGSAGAAASA